ncbi:MAG: TonB-dependent receptor, partial [Sulfuricella sp.]|nr:TonB-dependent receptor [Sulfuricella sp.]
MQFLNKPAAAICLTVAAAVAHAEDTAYDFNIPPQPVSQVLDALGKQTGLQPVYADKSIQGINSPGVKGRHSLREAVAKALAGTGLTFQFTAEKVVAIKVTSKEGVVRLAPVEVKASAMMGETDGYSVMQATTATKTNTLLLDTPMAVQAIPREILDDRQIVSIQEAVKNVSGVQTPPGVYYDVFQVRGFSTNNDTFRNGLKLNSVIGAEDIAFVDHVEIAKGPTGMLYGRIQPGGLVNIVTKKPQADFAASVQQQIGSWGQFRTVADVTGAANEDKSWLYRVIGVYDKGDSWVDFQHHENKALATYLNWRPSARFEANFQFEYYDQKTSNPGYTSQQIPVVGNRPANVPRNWTQNDPAMWSNWPNTVERTTLAFDWSYSFNDAWKLTHRFHYYTANEVQTYMLYQNFNSATNLLNRRISYNPVKRDQYSTNIDLAGEFKTGDITHKILFGLDYFDYRDNFGGYNESGATLNRVPAIDIFNPVYGNINVPGMQAFINGSSGNTLWKSTMKDTGLYLQDQIAFNERWELLLGGRYDIAKDASSTVYGSV